MTDLSETVAPLRELLAKATPGPWRRYMTGTGVFVLGTGPGKGNALYADPPGGTFPSNDLELVRALHAAAPALLDGRS